MKGRTAAAPLATPTPAARWAPAPRRDDLPAQARADLIFYLEDYAEMLETFAMGNDPETDRDTQSRVDGARALANRFK